MQNSAAVPGGLLAAVRAADRQRLAGDDAEHGVAHVHRVRVEDPGHRLRCRCRRPAPGCPSRGRSVDELAGEAARDALELAARMACGSQMMPPLPPPNGMLISAHFHVIHVASAFTSSSGDIGVVADAALGRAAHDVVLDAVALEDLRSCRRPSRTGPYSTAFLHCPRTTTRLGGCRTPSRRVVKCARGLERILASAMPPIRLLHQCSPFSE